MKNIFLIYLLNLIFCILDNFEINKNINSNVVQKLHTNQNIHIAVALHPQYLIVENISDFTKNPFLLSKEIPENEFKKEIIEKEKIKQNKIENLDFTNIIARSMLKQEGNGYKIKIGNSWLSINNNQTEINKNGDIFTIKPEGIGYTISLKDKCLTAIGQSKTLIVKKCNKNIYQYFIFIDKTKRYCEEENEIENIEEESINDSSDISEILNENKEKKKETKLDKKINQIKASKKMKKLIKKIEKKSKKWNLYSFKIC